MSFLTSRSASKHILLTLGVNPTARDAGKGGDSNLVWQATPLLVAVHVPPLHKSRIAKPRRRQANAVEFATEVWFSLFGGSEVIARQMLGTKGKLCNV